jgi:hypothetical protein
MENSNNTIRLNVLFHDDWEIFGDGSGNPEKLMFDPAKKILDICDTFGAKYTLFAEFGQQLAMLNSQISNHHKWANEWEKILKDAIKRGHDVQLHFHPQWIGAKYDNYKWQLNFDKWNLSSLEKNEIFRNLKEGKKYLENLLQPINKNYKIVAFRAGGWLNQPSKNIYNSMKKLGIKAETSIRKGIVRYYGKYGKIDFSYAPSSLHYWFADSEDFAVENKVHKDIISIPTYSIPLNKSLPLYLIQQRPSTITNYFKMYIKSKQRDYGESPKLIKQQGNSVYCNFGLLHYKNILDILNKAINECKKNNYLNVPFIMLTHSKSFNSYKNFEKLLSILRNYEKTNIITYKRTQEVVEQITHEQY